MEGKFILSNKIDKSNKKDISLELILSAGLGLRENVVFFFLHFLFHRRLFPVKIVTFATNISVFTLYLFSQNVSPLIGPARRTLLMFCRLFSDVHCFWFTTRRSQRTTGGTNKTVILKCTTRGRGYGTDIFFQQYFWSKIEGKYSVIRIRIKKNEDNWSVVAVSVILFLHFCQ